MKWLIILFLPFILGVAVAPTSLNGEGEVFVVNNIDQQVDYVVKGDFLVEPSKFSLGYGEVQKVEVFGTGSGRVVVYEVLDDDVNVVNAVAVKVSGDSDDLITGNAALNLSDLGGVNYSMWIVIGLVLVVGIVFWWKKGWQWVVSKAGKDED
tara:strand:- start:770 stop:1225 length:456 start_codon:yes stop_codon:yes gene_type:complete